MPWKWTDIPGSHPYTFTDVCGRDYAVHCVSLETRHNVIIQKRDNKTITRSLNPAKSIFGELIAPQSLFPTVAGIGPTCPIEGILHGKSLHLICLVFCPRYAPQGCLAYHVIDMDTYNALGGLLGRGTEWPVPSLPCVPRKAKPTNDMPNNLFDLNGCFRLRPSDN